MKSNLASINSVIYAKGVMGQTLIEMDLCSYGMRLNSGLDGQRVLVTAASRGIGFASARAFLEEGARVVINSSSPDRLSEAVKRLRGLGDVYGAVANLENHDDLDRLVREAVGHLGGIDTFVYVTGSPKPGVFLEQDYGDWESAARLLVVSPSYLARRVAEVMIQDSVKGRMVFSASVAIREPIPTIALSNVCRIAIAGLVRTLARELGPKNIRVNGILPGYIKTDRVDEVLNDAARRRSITPEQALKDLEGEIPLGHIGSPTELARTVVFLGSEMSSYVSGALIPVDGGLLHSVG
jgi:3-oxoacyl-[acyl-carrier protein] reductase